MKTWDINIYWTKYSKKYNEDFDFCRVLYMYGTKYEPIYVGETYDQTARERCKQHEKDDVGKWIKKNIHEPYGIKIGVIYLQTGIKTSAELLHDIQTLIIHLESTQRGFCRANVANTKSRDSYRQGMRIVNHNYFKPLVQHYYDEQ